MCKVLVIQVQGVPDLVGNAGGVQQPKEGIDSSEQVEQERGEDRALDGSCIQLYGCRAFPTHLHSHGGVLGDVLKQPDIRKLKPLQHHP